MNRFARRTRVAVNTMLLATLLMVGAGCAVTDAVVDGFYGGISDSVAGVVSSILFPTPTN